MARAARRERKTESFWRRMVRRQSGSGQSVRAWCRQQDVREPTFYWWRSELARRDRTAQPAVARISRRERPSFVPVRVTAEDSPAGDGVIEIVLGRRGDRVRLSGSVDRWRLAEVLAVLETPVC